MTHNPSFSTHNPKLQIAWDSSSFGALLHCPRYYQYTMLEGWRGDSSDLQFGGFIASALETYQKLRVTGQSKDEALLIAFKQVVTETWREDNTQWGGHFETMWKCEGTMKWKNAKGNAAKCPYSHKAAWFPDEPPSICGECGSNIIVADQYVPKHKTKHRRNLLIALVGYIDDQPADIMDGLHPYVFPDGTPAVELSFRLPLGRKSPHGEDYILCGHLDYIGEMGTAKFPVDNKTTGSSIGSHFFQSYSPNYQFDTYDLAGSIMFPDLELDGIMVDAIQVGVQTLAFGRRLYYKSEDQRAEHLRNIHEWISWAERYAEQDYWPMNKRNCWHCDMAKVCDKTPSAREMALKADFTKQETWNPLKER